MRKKLVIMYVTLILGMLVSHVNSDLTVQESLPGEFVVVDDDTGLMWVRDANLAQTSGYDSDGLMTWHEAMAWVDGLSYAGYDDWRLPVNLPVNGVAYDYNYSPDGTTDYGDNITSRSSEMSYLFHVTLENLSRTAPDGSSTQPGWPGGVLSNGPGPFINIMAHYPSGTSSWSGTEYGLDLSYSWLFSFNSGRQSYDLKEVSHYEAWAVRDGDVIPTIDAILEFFDESVADGSLVGDGPGKSANNRLNAFRKMIVKAGDMIDSGNISGACNKLDTVYNKCDGVPKPPDFIMGAVDADPDPVPELADMINELMISLECE